MGKTSVTEPITPEDDEESSSNSNASSSGAFQVGRIHMHWKGIHKLEETEGESVNQTSIKYYLVKTVETDESFKANTYYSCVPTTWISECMQFMLYPPVGTHFSNGKNQEPNQWRSNVFKRFRYPRNSWFEYDIVQIFNTKKPGSHDRVYKAASAAMKGVRTFEDILKSDNDATFGRGSRVKKKKVYDSELEQPKQKREKKATKVTDTEEVQATVITKACEGQSILPDAACSISEIYSDDLNRVVFPLLRDNWNEEDGNIDERSPTRQPLWLEQGEQTGEIGATQEPHRTMMDLDTHQLQPSNEITGYTSANGSAAINCDQHMMFRLLNALERVVSLENVVGNIAGNLSSQLQIIVEKIETLDQKVEALRKVNVHKMAAADFDHHKSVVETNFKELPVKSTTVVEAMDVSLRDNTLAISLVLFFVEELKTVKTVNKLFYFMMGFLVSKEVCNSMQWKMIPRGKDIRPGMAGLFNISRLRSVCKDFRSKERRKVKRRTNTATSAMREKRTPENSAPHAAVMNSRQMTDAPQQQQQHRFKTTMASH